MLDQIEETKFAALRKNCHNLGVPSPPEVFINMKVVESDGRVSRDEKFRAHSWTRNFYNWMFMTAGDAGGDGSNDFSAGKMSARRTDGTINDSNYAPYRGHYASDGGFYQTALSPLFGVQVGTGATAFDHDDYKLAAPIWSGTGSGHLSYHAHTSFGIKSYTGTTWKNIITRIMDNDSGALISVAETGLVWSGYLCSDTLYYYLMERNVLTSAVDVANGARLTVTYEISMDFSTPDA